MRLTEEQILNSQNNLVSFLNNFGSTIYDNFDLSSKQLQTQINEYSQKYFRSTKRWTKDEAHKMAFARYRNGYLGFELIEKLNNETLNID